MYNGNEQGALSFDVDNSIASLLGFRKVVYKPGKYASQKIIDIMDYSTNIIRCNLFLVLRIMAITQISYIPLL